MLQIDLMHIQIAPFNLQPGTVHAGLSGQAEITVSGIRGLSVTVTTRPSYLGTRPSDPPATFSFGRIAWGNSNGWIATRRVVNTPQVELDIQPLVTKIAYTFSPGVVATIAELVEQV
jgi:hypothetical protein